MSVNDARTMLEGYMTKDEMGIRHLQSYQNYDLLRFFGVCCCIAFYIYTFCYSSMGMTITFGLFAWSGVLVASVGLVMFYKCSRKDPGYISVNTRDSHNQRDDLVFNPLSEQYHLAHPCVCVNVVVPPWWNRQWTH